MRSLPEKDQGIAPWLSSSSRRQATFVLCAGSLLVTLLPGCRSTRPILTGIEPSQAYSDTPRSAYSDGRGGLRLALQGEGFTPATALDPTSGQRIAETDGFSARVGREDQWQDLIDLSWQSPGLIMATLSSQAGASLPLGQLDVELTDPRGETAVLQGGFSWLGPDTREPKVWINGIQSPLRDSNVPIFAPGMTIHGNVHASATSPGRLKMLSWSYSEDGGEEKPGGTCLLPRGATEADCPFALAISKPPQKEQPEIRFLRIYAEATEDAQKPVSGTDMLDLTLRPSTAIIEFSPKSGGSSGGTEIIIKGRSFLKGTYATLAGQPLLPDGGILVDETTVVGYTPAYAGGPADLKVIGPLGEDTYPEQYQYNSPPYILSVATLASDAGADGRVSIYGEKFTQNTRIYVGKTVAESLPLLDQTWEDPGPISGRLPTKSGSTFLWACDPALGCTRWQTPYTWSTP